MLEGPPPLEIREFAEIQRMALVLDGAPIWVRWLPELTAHRGKLLSQSTAGQPVFAGSFLRRREVVLDSALLEDSDERARILVHELFHFAWLRLGNPRRVSWKALLAAEAKARARGDLGWSAEWRKAAGAVDYPCESFCDSAAWLYAQVEAHAEFTLARRWRAKRRLWFQAHVGGIVKI